MKRPAGQAQNRPIAMLVFLAASVAITGCHRQTTVANRTPPPPAPSTTTHRELSAAPALPPDINGELAAAAPGFFDDTSTLPTFTETGIASWYGPYANRRTADGSAYDGMGMTAAHKTLPLGSTVRVTNLSTGQQILVRVTDRGPFVAGRVIDLSINAAKAIGLYRTGISKVRLEAFSHPGADPAGKWCVQAGAFKTEADALDLKAALIKRYNGARVAEFAGATGFWVRIDPSQHAKAQADEIAEWIGQPDPQALPYIVRLN